MMWFLGFDIGFHQGFWVFGWFCGQVETFLELPDRWVNPKPIIMGLCYSLLYEDNC